MQVTMTIENADALLATFRRAPGIASKEFLASLEKVAAKVVSEAQHASPVGKYPGGGNLRQSIRYTRYGATGFVVWVNAQYGVYVDQGTKPHLILPRRKPFLAFQKDGRWIFTKRVNHPGTRAQPFFTNAVKTGETYANTELAAAMDRVLSQI